MPPPIDKRAGMLDGTRKPSLPALTEMCYQPGMWVSQRGTDGCHIPQSALIINALVAFHERGEFTFNSKCCDLEIRKETKRDPHLRAILKNRRQTVGRTHDSKSSQKQEEINFDHILSDGGA